MLTVDKLIPQGRGLAGALLKRAARVELDWDTRQKSRFDATDSAGRALGVFLPRGSVVRGGDVLVAEDGTLVRVDAAAQPVLVVRAAAGRDTPLDLTRAAYHLGNRHVALELRADRLLLEPDHVLAEMLRRMGLDAYEAHEPFEPEAGAYAAAHGGHERHAAHGQADPNGHGHGHVHGPGCGHDHAPHADNAAPGAGGHVHGPGCAHDHTPHASDAAAGAGGHVHAPGCAHDHAARTPDAAAGAGGHVHGPGCAHDHGAGHDAPHRAAEDEHRHGHRHHRP